MYTNELLAVLRALGLTDEQERGQQPIDQIDHTPFLETNMANTTNTNELLSAFEAEYPNEVRDARAEWKMDHVTREAFQRMGLGLTDYVRTRLADQHKRLSPR
jgi:hypothetical protein